jgi:hypothetical protein
VTGAGETRGDRFRYETFTIDAEAGVVHCTYSIDGLSFTETIAVDGSPHAWAGAAATAAARLVFLLAGVSYYKTRAPRVIDTGQWAVTDLERAFLHDVYTDGLAEFAYKAQLDLSGIVIEGPRLADPAPGGETVTQSDRPLVPFGGGIDSIVVVEQTRRAHPDTMLFIASRAVAPFEPIEAGAAVTGLPVVRADRQLDEQVLLTEAQRQERGLHFFNGHVPVTGILSAIAVLAAVLNDRDAVVMSNEWSASSATLTVDGRDINHQWSKSYAFEALFRDVVTQSVPGVRYFSALRPYSELWVAERFAALPDYHLVFRSCNRAFNIDPAKRLDHWCGECDKCCFIDLILAPYVDAERLREIFGGSEPLDNEALLAKFQSLIGDPELTKAFECVGDAGECRAAVRLAADRPDRAGSAVLQRLAADIAAMNAPVIDIDALLAPIGSHFIEAGYAASDLVG